MIIRFCVAGVVIGIPISIKRKSFLPFAGLGLLGSLVDYNVPYVSSCHEINEQYQQAVRNVTHDNNITTDAQGQR